MTRRPAFYLGPRGLIFAWCGPLGPTVARYGSSSRERPAFVATLGHPGAELPQTPELLVGADRVVPFWCEEDGAWAARYDLEGELLGEPRLVLPGARRVALAAGRSGAVLFGGDGRGLLSRRLDALGEPLEDPRRHAGETRPAPLLSAQRVRDESLCVAVYPGEPGWTTLAIGDGAPKLVRHHHVAPIDDVRVRSVGSRAVILLTARSQIEMGIVSGSGRVIERPHPVFARGSGALGSADAVWADDRWVVLAHALDADVVLAQPLAKRAGVERWGKGLLFSLPECAGAFSAMYHSQTYYALEVEPVGDGAELRLWRCSKVGDAQQRRVDLVAHPGAAATRRRRVVRSALAGLASRMGQARGYRDHAARPTLARDGTSLELLDERGRLSLSVLPDAESEGLVLRVASALGDDPELEEAPSSLVRLAAWVRERLSSAASEAARRRLAWATELAAVLDARVRRVDRAGNTLVLELLLDALPSPEALQRWLGRLRDAQAEAP